MTDLDKQKAYTGSSRPHERVDQQQTTQLRQQLQYHGPPGQRRPSPSPRPSPTIPGPNAKPFFEQSLPTRPAPGNRNLPTPPLRPQLSFDFSRPTDQYSSSPGADGGIAPPRTASPKMMTEMGRGKRAPGHSRSMSNSAAAELMSRSRRADDDGIEGAGLGVFSGGVRKASDVTDDNFHQSIVPKSRAADARGDGKPSKDALAAGTCMTCATPIQYPKTQDSFKCQTCQCATPIRSAEGGFRQHRLGSNGAGSPPVQAFGGRAPITVEHTRALIKHCLSTFITWHLRLPVDVRQQPPSPGIGTGPEPFRGFSNTNPFTRARQDSSSAQRTGSPSRPNGEEFNLRPPPRSNTNPHPRSASATYQERPVLPPPHAQHRRNNSSAINEDPWRRAFRPLEDYISRSFGAPDCLNMSFMTQGHRPSVGDRSNIDAALRRKLQQPPQSSKKEPATPDTPTHELDPKLLMMGNTVQDGLLRVGGQADIHPPPPGIKKDDDENNNSPIQAPTRPHMVNWGEVAEWYSLILNCAQTGSRVFEELVRNQPPGAYPAAIFRETELQLIRAQSHVQRVLIRASEALLREPGRLMANPEDMRFLLIILENPMLHPDFKPYRGHAKDDLTLVPTKKSDVEGEAAPTSVNGGYATVTSRIWGLMSNSSKECNRNLIAWFAKFPADHLARIKTLAADFLTHRLHRQAARAPEAAKVDIIAGLIPNMNAGRSAATLHAALGSASSPKPGAAQDSPNRMLYREEWALAAVVRVLAIIFKANNAEHLRQDRRTAPPPPSQVGDSSRPICVRSRGQLLPTSDFYNYVLDQSDLAADFQRSERNRARFSFCKYPFLLSIWAKTRILEHDAMRQMSTRAREAFFESMTTNRESKTRLDIQVRRDCLVEDSLTAVSQVIGSGSQDIKKRLVINFKGEEGVDGGGLRKEWFLLLIREVFDPLHGLFVYDENSQYCYFNPNTLEKSNQFYLVGVVLGLAIYNLTILDIALPPFVFRRLLLPSMAYTCTVDDLAEVNPSVADGLRNLLDYDGNVEEDFGLDFSITVNYYGVTHTIPLVPDGELRAVTNTNRREYVNLRVRHVLETAVSKQFEPFKRGFLNVCAGSALNLFRPEEIELLVRGSDEPLDVAALRTVAKYENWDDQDAEMTSKVIDWFWDSFANASTKDQRQLLCFITGSDRIPAYGPSSMQIKIVCMGDDRTRFPNARTCFNMLGLYLYDNRQDFEYRLWTAVKESEGFGLK